MNSWRGYGAWLSFTPPTGYRGQTEAYRQCNLTILSVVSRIIDGGFRPKDYCISPKQVKVSFFDVYVQDIILLRYPVPVYRNTFLKSLLNIILPVAIAITSIALLFIICSLFIVEKVLKEKK